MAEMITISSANLIFWFIFFLIYSSEIRQRIEEIFFQIAGKSSENIQQILKKSSKQIPEKLSTNIQQILEKSLKQKTQKLVGEHSTNPRKILKKWSETIYLYYIF